MSELIAFTGAPNTGKTMAAYQRACQLKIIHPELTVGVLCDGQMFCPFPVNRIDTGQCRMWSFTNQIRRELEMLSRFDMVVTERTIVDIIAHTAGSGFDSLALAMLELAVQHMPVYTEIIFRKISTHRFWHSGIADDGIEELLEAYYEELLHSQSITGVFTHV